MPYIVNGQIVPEELIRQQNELLDRDPQWNTIKDAGVRAQQVRAAAESSAADQLLIAQIAAADPRPLDPGAIACEVQRLRSQPGCRGSLDDEGTRAFIERELKIQRIRREMVAGYPKTSPQQTEEFFNTHRERFQKPEMFHAAHIVKNVTQDQNEQQALAGIEIALAELERGDCFGDVADRHSDCKGNGGDLGQFPPGYMVDEFEAALRALEPGRRTGIFTTPFGFHIAELRAKIPAGGSSFEEVRADIERVMNFAAEHEAYLRAIAGLRSRAEIRWVPAPQAAAT